MKQQMQEKRIVYEYGCLDHYGKTGSHGHTD